MIQKAQNLIKVSETVLDFEQNYCIVEYRINPIDIVNEYQKCS